MGFVNAVSRVVVSPPPPSPQQLVRELYAAVEKGDIRRIEALHQQGVDLNASLPEVEAIDFVKERKSPYEYVLTPLAKAINSNQTEAALTLIKLGANIDEMNAKCKIHHLHVAARKGNVKLIEDLAKKGAKLDSVDALGSAPLHWVVQTGTKEAIEVLLGAGADPNVPSAKGVTPLHFAFQYRGEEIIKALIQRGAKLDAKDKNGFSCTDFLLLNKEHFNANLALLKSLDPSCFHWRSKDGNLFMHLLAQIGTPEQIKKAIELGADPNVPNSEETTPLHYAFKYNQRGAIEALLDGGAKLDAKDKEGYSCAHWLMFNKRYFKENLSLLMSLDRSAINQRTRKEITPLHELGQYGTPEQIKELINAGADPNVPNFEGMTPLHFAFENNQSEAIKVLINGKAELNVKDNLGWSCVHPLVHNKNYFKENLVLLMSLDPLAINQRTNDGLTVLHLLGQQGTPGQIREFIKWGADPHAPDPEGKTPLHYAFRNNQREAIKALIRGGAKLDAKDNQGRSCAHFLMQGKEHFKDNLNLLMSLDPSAINQRTNQGIAPLHWLVSLGTVEQVEAFIEAGADITVRNSSGNTPLHLACVEDCDEQKAFAILKKSMFVDFKENKQGYNPLHRAIQAKKSLGLIKELLRAGIPPDRPTHDGFTALHLACHAREVEVVEALLEAGADLFARNIDGHLPVHSLCWNLQHSVDILRLFATQKKMEDWFLEKDDRGQPTNAEKLIAEAKYHSNTAMVEFLSPFLPKLSGPLVRSDRYPWTDDRH